MVSLLTTNEMDISVKALIYPYKVMEPQGDYLISTVPLPDNSAL